MPNEQGQPNQQQIQIKITDDILRGAYANAMSVAHTKEEFILDFMTVIPHQRAGTVSARILTSPGHLKRIISALQENLKKYEGSFGKVDIADAPGSEIGFTAN